MKIRTFALSVSLFISALLMGQESISIIDFTGAYPANIKEYPVKVSYTVEVQKDLFLEIQFENKYIGGERITVEPGSGEVTLTATFENSLITGNNYTATASIRTVGGNWQTITESDTKSFTIANEGGGGDLNEIYVSTKGDDSNDGSFEAPLRTIQKASELMADGGTCYIRGGVYRETVVVKHSNQTFTNYMDEYVEISGADVVTGWTLYKDHIYKANLSNVQPQFTQVFFDGKYQKIARYPDLETEDRLNIKNGYADCNVKPDGIVLFDNTLPGGTDHWKGGYFRGIAGLTWWNPMGKITASSGKNLTCEMISKTWIDGNEKSIGNGVGFILHLNALSKPGEWYHENNTLYFWKPGGNKPSDTEVEAQKRILAFVLDGQNNITMENLHIKAATLRMNNSNNCKIKGCSFRYQKGFYTRENYHWSYTEHGGAFVNGNNNSFDSCYFKGTWGNLMNVENGSGNSFTNSIFEDNGWISQFTACIQNGSENLNIERNTFGSTGRFHIRSDRREHSNKMDLLHNDFYDCMKVGQDAGSIEVTNGGSGNITFDMGGSEIAYNTFRDMSTISSFYSTKNFVVALYMEGAANYTAHHNLCYNIRTQYAQGTFVYLGPRDCVIDNVKYYNNTVWDVDKMIGVWNRTPAQAGIENMDYTNNIFYGSASIDFGNPSLEAGVSMTTNLSSTSNNIFTDVANNDFTLRDASAALDYGTEIPGITDGYSGTAPDAGCFEKEIEAWTCGAPIPVPTFPEDTAATKYILTVNNGTGGGYFLSGAEIEITANEIEGKEFVEWTGDIGHVANPLETTTTVTIPESDIELNASYKDIDTGMESLTRRSFVMYPNPAKKKLTLELDTPTQTTHTLQIFGINGKLHVQRSVNFSTTVDIQELSAGLYFVKVDDRVRKLVVE